MWRPTSRASAAAPLAVALVLGAGACGGESGGGNGGAPRFVDESATAGIDHRYTGEFAFFVGGGVAAFDCNDDGRSELYFAGGASPAALYLNESPVGGALRFSPLASPVTDLADVTGAYPLDVDSDGHSDLVVLRRGGNTVLRGLGDCRFEDVTGELAIERADTWTVGFSATWEGTNALPTLAFGNYLIPDGDGDGCGDNELLRPATSGDSYAPPVALPAYCTLSLLFSDWNRTGERDLRVANDRHYYREGSEQLWRIVPGEPPQEYTAADGWRPLQIWGMGIAAHDLTGDGRPEYFITSQGDNKLQALDDGATGPAFHDIAIDRGVTAAQPYAGGDVLPSTAWHPEFADVNNDGNIDLFVTKGNVEGQVDQAMRDPSNLLLGTGDGTFTESGEAAGVVAFDRARGAALVDLNLDGLLDMVVVNREAPVTVRRNFGTGDAAHPAAMGHWLALRLHQPAPNTDAIGAWVEVKVGGRTVTREVTVGGGHAGGQLGWLHTGLGPATTVEVRVLWPDGEVGPWVAVDADQFVVLDRSAVTAERWTPGESGVPNRP